MAAIQAPLHAVRLLVVAALVGLLSLSIVTTFHMGLIAWLGSLVTVGALVWLRVQPTARPVLDGALTGLILGLGLGGLLGYGAYFFSDACIFLQCDKDPAAFWVWFVPILLGQVILGAAVGSLGANKDRPIPGLEDLPLVRR